MSKCLTKLGRQCGFTPLVEADMEGNRYLGDYNERIERMGYEDMIAAKLYAKGQFWLDRYNKLAGNS
jgi:hypothetical protein